MTSSFIISMSKEETMVSVLIAYAGWFVLRALFTRLYYFDFDWDGVHHADLGFSLVCTGIALHSCTMIVIGSLLVIDDMIGHRLKRLGYLEEGPIEYILRKPIVVIWRWINQR